MKLSVSEQERGQYHDVRRDVDTPTTRDRYSLRGICRLPFYRVGWNVVYKRKSIIPRQVKQTEIEIDVFKTVLKAYDNFTQHFLSVLFFLLNCKLF